MHCRVWNMRWDSTLSTAKVQTSQPLKWRSEDYDPLIPISSYGWLRAKGWNVDGIFWSNS